MRKRPARRWKRDQKDDIKIGKTTSRGTHITKQQQHRRGERERESTLDRRREGERESENPQINKKNKHQTTKREKDRKTNDEKIKSGFNQLAEDLDRVRAPDCFRFTRTA